MKMLTLTVVLVLFPWVSQAQGWGYSNYHNNYRSHHNNAFWDNVESRQHRLHRRIDRGVKHGQLTRREIKKLRREEKHIAKQVRHYKRHGYISSSDKREIEEHLDYVSHKVRKLKHNNRYPGWRHDKHNHQEHTYYDNNRRYRNKPTVSWSNDYYSGGIYFRF